MKDTALNDLARVCEGCGGPLDGDLPCGICAFGQRSVEFARARNPVVPLLLVRETRHAVLFTSEQDKRLRLWVPKRLILAQTPDESWVGTLKRFLVEIEPDWARKHVPAALV